MPQKIHHKKSRFARTNSRRKIVVQQLTTRYKIKIRYLVVALAVAALSFCNFGRMLPTMAAGCPDVKILFARGSGGVHNTDKNYLAFRSALISRLATTHLRYEIEDLDYPAVDVGPTNLFTTLGALIGGGESYKFGASVSEGSSKIIAEVNSSVCPNTKYVLGGYSQGAMAISKSLMKLNPDKIIYIATFGDPKIFLPEGKGPFPPACQGRELSDYRMYVPDCQTYSGMLGGYEPYRPETLSGKVGTWCNKHDFFCSPYLSMSSHTGYVSADLYNDAAKMIFYKISQHFGFDSPIASPHDTVIMIDSTRSMQGMIGKFKAEALRLARETFASGGRVALYDYRDLDDPYDVVKHCDFVTCDIATIENALNSLKVGGGGDRPESLLSATFKSMETLSWQHGAVKSMVVLTDSEYLSPDRDKVSFADVVALSKSIDPVNFYIVTVPAIGEYYTELAEQTGGKVVTNFNELSLLTDYIMDRFDSLPKVEETEPIDLPTLTIDSVENLTDGSARVKFTNSGLRALVVLNDAILGVTEDNEFVINELNPAMRNTITLVPLTDLVHGEAVSAVINDGATFDDLVVSREDNFSETSSNPVTGPNTLPKAPNTSRAKLNPHFTLGIVDGFYNL